MLAASPSRASRATTLTEREGRLFDSGISADRTTMVLDKSASWRVVGRGGGEGPGEEWAGLVGFSG